MLGPCKAPYHAAAGAGHPVKHTKQDKGGINRKQYHDDQRRPKRRHAGPLAYQRQRHQHFRHRQRPYNKGRQLVGKRLVIDIAYKAFKIKPLA